MSAEKSSTEAGTRKPFPWDDAVALVFAALLAEPFCHVGADLIMHDETGKGIVAFSIGIPIGILGVTFHWWKQWFGPKASEWALKTAERAWPVVLVLIFIYLSSYLNFKPATEHVNANTPSADEIAKAVVKALQPSQNAGMFNEAVPKPLAPPRSKQAINELLEESGLILSVIEKAGPPLITRWQAIANQNPERICLEINGKAFLDSVSTLEVDLVTAHNSIIAVYQKNRIDQPEFDELMVNLGIDGFRAGGEALKIFHQAINLANGRSCQDLVNSNYVPSAYAAMSKAQDKFIVWVAQSQDRFNAYRDALRKELRNAT